MSDRTASCTYCGETAPSSPSLAFFEDRGPDSKRANETCAICLCYEVAHQPRGDDAPISMRGKIPSVIGEPHDFKPHGAYKTDGFYCGCRGWE